MFSGPQITVPELMAELEKNSALQVVDIRQPQDYAEWHIAEAQHLDVYQALHFGQPGELEAYRPPDNQPVVVVCYVGQTSQLAANYLRGRGITAHSLIGGMAAWGIAWNIANTSYGSAIVTQFRRTGKGCLSYLLQVESDCLLIDPSLEPEVYLRYIQKHNLTLLGVLDTHIHADHITRGPILAKHLNTGYFLPNNPRTKIEFLPLHAGQIWQKGGLKFEVLPLPGHTPESIGIMWDNTILFTGDTLFLDGFGRPDLIAASSDSDNPNQTGLHNTLLGLEKLNPDLWVFPSHTHDPVAFTAPILTGQLGSLIRQLQIPPSFAEFQQLFLQHLPPPPANHQLIVAANITGRLPTPNITMLEAGPNRCAIRTS